MKPILFLEPVFENDVFKYIIYNFNQHQTIECIGVRKSLYIFCKTEALGRFKEYMEHYQDCIPRTDQFDADITIHRVMTEYQILTNASPIAFMSRFRMDDFTNKCVMYIFSALTEELFKKLKIKMKNLQIIFPYFYILEPENIEMEIMLSKLFEYKQTEHLDIKSKVTTIKVHNNLTFIAGKKIKLDQIYTPTGIYDCFINDGKVNRFLCNSTNNSRELNNFLHNLPRIKISFSTVNNINSFEPDEQLLYIIISIYCLEKCYHYVLINNSKTLNSNVALIQLKYKLEYNTSDLKSKNIFYMVMDSESEMLLKFINLYCNNEIFQYLNQTSGPIHWLVNNEAQYSLLLLDRIFFLKMGYQVLRFLTTANNHVKLNKYAIQYNVHHKNPILPSDTINIYNYINDIIKVPNNNVELFIGQSTNTINITASPVNSSFTDYTYTAKERYKHIADGQTFKISTPISLINQTINVNSKILLELSPENIIKISNKLNYSLSNLTNATNFQKNTLLVFYHFLEHGYILLPCLSIEPSYSILPLQGIERLMTQSKEYHTVHGGYVYSKNNTIYRMGYISHIDFKSYYASILATFQISFNNTMIINGQDLLAYIKNSPTLEEYLNLYCKMNMNRKDNPPSINAPLTIIYDLDDLDNFKSIRNTQDIKGGNFYLIIFENPINMPTLGSLAAGFITEDSSISQCDTTFKKKMINSLCGCLTNSKFKYTAPHIYRAVVYLGCRIINFVSSIASSLIDGSLNITDACKLFNTNFNAVPCHNIINIDTDGFSIFCRNSNESDVLCKTINSIFNELFETFNTDGSPNRKNYIKCRSKFNTDYMINCQKKKYIYIEDIAESQMMDCDDIGNNSRNIKRVMSCGFNINKRQEDIILNYYSNSSIDYNLLRNDLKYVDLLI